MKRTLYLLFFAAIVLNSCEEKDTSAHSNADTIKIMDTIPTAVLHSGSIKPVCKDTLTLFEHSLNNTPIPFTNTDVRTTLATAFPEYKLNSYMDYDPQDGVTFLVYSLSIRDTIAAELYMQEADTLRLGRIESSSPFFKDAYGIMAGDSFETLTKGKAGEYTVHHNPSWASFVTFKNSNIYYEIQGETTLSENPTIPPEPLDPEMKDWKVAKIVWQSNNR